jgi:hypothetical protein
MQPINMQLAVPTNLLGASEIHLVDGMILLPHNDEREH